MNKVLHFSLTLFAMFLCGLLPGGAANTVTIPTTSGSYISWNDCDLTGANVENSGANIGSTGASTVATFTISNTTQQDYILTFATGSKNEARLRVTLTNTSDNSVVLTKDVDVINTGAWTPSIVHNFLISQLPTGTFELKFQVTQAASYAGNWGNLAFYTTTGYNTAPGTVAIATGTYSGARLENNNTNVGYVSNGTSATYNFICSQAGVYKMTIPMTRYGDGTITTTITDDETGTVEASSVWTITNPSNYADTDVNIDGELTTGLKTMTLQFATSSSFLLNYKDITMTRIADHFSKISGVTVTGQTVTAGDDTDWYCQLPVNHGNTTTFGVTAVYGTVTATAVDAENQNVAVTDNGDGTFTLATPAAGSYNVITLTLTPTSGTAYNKTVYTLKLFRIGEVTLSNVTVDGKDIGVVSDINTGSGYTATYSGCYTTAPTVTAVQIDGSAATVGSPVINGSTYTYTIHGEIGSFTRDFTLILNNVHVYASTVNDETVNIKANEGTIANNTWSNGLYTLSTTSLDSYNAFFKMNGDSYTISVPADVVVKQVIMKDVSNNYANNDARLTAVTSTGATAYIPVDNKYYHSSEGSQHDIVVNIDNHAAGTDIVLTQQKSGQPMAWIQLTIEKQTITTPPTVSSQNVTVVNNHAVVTLTFDREMTSTTATINGGSVTAEGGSATLCFPVWNLSYSTNYTLTIAAGAARDIYNNANAAAINVSVNTSARPTVTKKAYDYVVGTVAELQAAIAAVNSSNTNASASRKTIFIKNGDYNLGNKVGQGVSLSQLRCYNVSLIGESCDGVIIHGDVDGISNPVLNLRDRSGFYLQDLTVRNDRDYGNGLFNGGVAVAIYGGDKTVMKNVRMLSNQDTQVTGHRAYFENCEIHGSVDFICGGGDNYYYNTDLVLEDRGGNAVTAPSTNSAHKWGYVFQGCTIKAVEGATAAIDGSYSLGRPWQNEPRCYYLNTTMNVLPSDNGWAGMSTLPTHFYEYNSKNSSGTAIDLSKRGNSSTSTNTYTPVLTAEEAAKFTVENVLGGTDSWLPTEQTVIISAPVITLSGNTISWSDVTDALCYVVFKDGEYVADITDTSYDVTGDGVYTVRAANFCGGLGAVSNEVNLSSAATISITTDVTGWATGCFGSDVRIPAGTKAYYINNVTKEGDEAVLGVVPVTEIPAGQGFVFNGIQGEHELEVISGAATFTGNKLVGTLEETAVSDIYVLGIVDAQNNVGFLTYTGSTLAANKAYLPKSEAQGASILRFSFTDVDTSISGVTKDIDTDSGAYYDIQGRKVSTDSSPQRKGIYIHNGKKIIIK